MVRYANLGGDSNVTAYEFGSDSIQVQFGDGSIYLYTYQSASRSAIEEMKRLAIAGQGLNTYISKVVKDKYAAKLM